MAQCIQKFKQGPTYIETEFVSQNEAEFPALTICPETIRYKEDVLKKNKMSRRFYTAQIIF